MLRRQQPRAERFVKCRSGSFYVCCILNFVLSVFVYVLFVFFIIAVVVVFFLQFEEGVEKEEAAETVLLIGARIAMRKSMFPFFFVVDVPSYLLVFFFLLFVSYAFSWG